MAAERGFIKLGTGWSAHEWGHHASAFAGRTVPSLVEIRSTLLCLTALRQSVGGCVPKLLLCSPSIQAFYGFIRVLSVKIPITPLESMKNKSYSSRGLGTTLPVSVSCIP